MGLLHHKTSDSPVTQWLWLSKIGLGTADKHTHKRGRWKPLFLGELRSQPLTIRGIPMVVRRAETDRQSERGRGREREREAATTPRKKEGWGRK